MCLYLNPKADVVFWKIFGRHSDLLMSFLNAILPLADDQHIVELEYPPVEKIHSVSMLNRTIVHVKCKDKYERAFIVEVQMEGSPVFMQRLLFAGDQGYVKQLSGGTWLPEKERYDLFLPVYGLGLVNGVFDKERSDWYHHYSVVKVERPKEKIVNGLTLIFIELPKLKVNTGEDNQLKILWLRFLKELDEETKEISPELLAVPEIKEAVHLAQKSVYTVGELEYYESYWKQVSSEKSLKEDAKAGGLADITIH